MRSESLEQSLDAVRSLTEFAYQQGYHEMGYDPVESLIAAVRQAAFAEVAAKVKALRSSCGSAPDGTPCCVEADEVLALLATPPDTGTP